ncbi:hypothetical protein [Bradyrhizobium erythrophlei]|uniref:hypothetical protein n=1 Tax=Bradyrhizobium erythrophlei TaxID=1437360 RepID=UPI0012EC17D8|nr:hypothetical protein [Bradyrhizobium erythrophlei]
MKKAASLMMRPLYLICPSSHTAWKWPGFFFIGEFFIGEATRWRIQSLRRAKLLSTSYAIEAGLQPWPPR